MFCEGRLTVVKFPHGCMKAFRCMLSSQTSLNRKRKLSNTTAQLPSQTQLLKMEIASAERRDRVLQLTEDEQRLFRAVIGLLNSRQLSATVRVAGGWVRDKLLGNQSNDIDLALDTMSGQEFAIALREYMEQSGDAGAMSGFGVIKANPDQSKHLETATFRLFGMDIDCTNLRTETYSSDSRIPSSIVCSP